MRPPRYSLLQVPSEGPEASAPKIRRTTAEKLQLLGTADVLVRKYPTPAGTGADGCEHERASIVVHQPSQDFTGGPGTVKYLACGTRHIRLSHPRAHVLLLRCCTPYAAYSPDTSPSYISTE